MEGGLGRRSAEAEREMREAVRPDRKLSGQGDVAVRRGVVLVGQLKMARENVPPVGEPDEADRAREERQVGGHRQERTAAGGEKHAVALVVAAPTCVVRAAVDEMRRQQREQAQGAAAQVFEPDLHQHRIAARIGDHALDDAEAAADMRAREQKGGHAVFERLHD